FVGKQALGGQAWATKNSGVMLHCQSPQSMKINQGFPVSLEAQLLGGLEEGIKRPTANLCTPGLHVTLNDELETTHCINSTSKTFYGEEWIDIEVEVYNDSLISHFVNGKEVITYSNPVIGGQYNTLLDKEGESVKGGYISFQSESHPIEFKNILLLNLDKQ
uniref:3-keto-disaccharide hydrolase n=1 Tax=uncultured Winogradskyella sp. TaxID=395353 RepID=UPI0026281E3F